MAQITVVVQKLTSVRPAANSAFDHTDIEVTDSSSVKSTQAVNGQEASPWTGVFTVANGVGSVKLTDFDDNDDPIGTPVVVSFDTGTPNQQTYPASVGASITVTG